MLALLANAATNFVQAGMRRLRCVWLDTHAERALAVGWVFEGSGLATRAPASGL